MAGGTQVTTTNTKPWEGQEEFMKRGYARAEDLYSTGRFTPAFYGAQGTVSQGAAAIPQVAPGVAAFSPRQRAPMDAIYALAMGDRQKALQAQTERAYLGAEGVPGLIPYSQEAMNYGQNRGMATGPGGYASMLPFQAGQYESMLRGDIDTGQFGNIADVYRREAQSQLENEMLPAIRSKLIGYGQTGGSSRGDLIQAKAISSANQRASDNIAKAMFDAQTRATAGRLPAAQMGLGAQQFGMGYGLEGMRGAREAMGLYPALTTTPFAPLSQAQEIGEQERALNQAAIQRDLARYEYQAGLPTRGLQSYLAGISGQPGGSAMTTGPSGSNIGETLLTALIASQF